MPTTNTRNSTPRRREFLAGISGSSVAAFGAPQSASAQPPGKPNILIVMTDQQRVGLTRRSGFPLNTMPALDRLAARGAPCDGAYTTAPLCGPARVSMLTGRWPHAHRVRQNAATGEARFERDIFDVLRQAGYKTGLTGKNHSHLKPERLDFCRLYSHASGWTPEPAPAQSVEFTEWMKQLNHAVSEVPTPFPPETQYPFRIVSDAIEFIDTPSQKPFALWVSFPEPHNPYQVPKPYFDMFPPESLSERAVGPEALKAKGFKWEWLHGLEDRTYPGFDQNWRRLRSNYLGMLRLIDDQLARLMDHMDSRGLLANTIIVFVSDHGDFVGDYGLMRKGVGIPEVLTRVPMIWYGPGIKPVSNVDALVSLADVMPTLCEAIGAPIPFGVQGRSLWPLLQGREYPREEFRSVYAEVGFGGLHYRNGDPVPPKTGMLSGAPGARPTFDELNSVTQSGNLKMVRWGTFKLTSDMMGEVQLYDLATDPFELKNLYGTPEVAAEQSRLLAELLKWTVRTEDDLPSSAYVPRRSSRNWYAQDAQPG